MKSLKEDIAYFDKMSEKYATRAKILRECEEIYSNDSLIVDVNSNLIKSEDNKVYFSLEFLEDLYKVYGEEFAINTLKFYKSFKESNLKYIRFDKNSKQILLMERN